MMLLLSVLLLVGAGLFFRLNEPVRGQLVDSCFDVIDCDNDQLRSG